MARWSKVEISGVNTSTLPVLSRDEAKALFIEAKAGSESARQTLIQGNLRLVLSVIKKFDGRNENPDDLFQVGCIGLIKGIDNFNPDMDVYPSTYLVPMILGEVRRYLRDSGSVRVSRSMRDTAYKVLQAKEKFIAEHQREPSVEEIAKILDIKREDVVLPWTPSWTPSPSTNPSTPTAGTPSASWTRSGTRKTPMKTGSNKSP